jgi:hypothetical protein
MLLKVNRELNYRVMLEQALDYMFRHQISDAIPSNVCTLEQFCDLLRAHIELTDDLAAKEES